jgi:8-amino-7-oxononanoate synthase
MNKLEKKINERINNQTFRSLKTYDTGIDFFSNDYLGYAQNNNLISRVKEVNQSITKLGSTGSRLISGNSKTIMEVENYLADFYDVESALLFPSGYIANLALFSCIAQKGDTILYDELIHASIREAVRLSFAKTYSFKHLNYEDLENKIKKSEGEIYVVLEGLYSMDGDVPNAEKLIELKNKYHFHLIIDEAHSGGIIGKNFKGFYENLPSNLCFSRIHTFGKAFGYHGAVITGSKFLKEFLINFSKPFIYSTGIPNETAKIIQTIHSYHLENASIENERLQRNILYYKELFNSTQNFPIQLLFSNDVKKVEKKLLKENLLVKAIFPPTVPEKSERIRIVLHSYNTKNEINQLFELVKSVE